MDEFKEKHLRPNRKATDQFIIAAVLTTLLVTLGGSLTYGGQFFF